MGSDVFNAALELVHETEQMLKVVLLPNAYGWPERHEGVNSHGRQFVAAWNEVRRLWDPDLEGRLAGRRTDAVAFRAEVLAGCWLRVAKDLGLRVLAALQRLHDSQLGRPLVLKVRPTPRDEPEAPILAFSAEHVPAIMERFGQEPAFTWQEPPEQLTAAIRRDFAPLIVGIRQERAWAKASAVDPPKDPPPDQPRATEYPEALVGKGVEPRDDWFVRQWEAEGTDTYQKPGVIHKRWANMPMEDRKRICPDAPGICSHTNVKQAIYRRRKK